MNSTTMSGPSCVFYRCVFFQLRFFIQKRFRFKKRNWNLSKAFFQEKTQLENFKSVFFIKKRNWKNSNAFFQMRFNLRFRFPCYFEWAQLRFLQKRFIPKAFYFPKAFFVQYPTCNTVSFSFSKAFYVDCVLLSNIFWFWKIF